MTELEVKAAQTDLNTNSETGATMEFKKAFIIFLIIAAVVIITGMAAGELLFWDRYDSADPVAKDIAYFEKLAQKDRGNDRVLVELGYLYYRKGDYQKAIDTLSKAVEVNRLNPGAHFNLGLSYQEVKLLGKAEDEYLKTLELDPESRFAYFALGKLYYTQEKWDEAIKQLELATAKDPVSADNYYWLGQAYEKLGHRAEARAAYKKVTELVPGHKEAKEAYYRVK